MPQHRSSNEDVHLAPQRACQTERAGSRWTSSPVASSESRQADCKGLQRRHVCGAVVQSVPPATAQDPAKLRSTAPPSAKILPRQ